VIRMLAFPLRIGNDKPRTGGMRIHSAPPLALVIAKVSVRLIAENNS
jgi:hypothetical protein